MIDEASRLVTLCRFDSFSSAGRWRYLIQSGSAQPKSGFYLAQPIVDEQQYEMEVLRLQEIDQALKKIEEGTCGYCESSGEPIDRARLEARPTAIYSVVEKERREQGSQPARN